MGCKEEYEQEIDLRDLLFHILYRWRSVLLAAILVCALTGGYGVVKSGGFMPGAQQEQAGEAGKINVGKYAAVGFFGGAFVMAFLYGTGYVLSDKLRGARELRERYGYYLLGTLPGEEKRKFLGSIDRRLKKLEGAAQQITEEDAYWIISINIINLAKSGGTFLITGTAAPEKLEEFRDVISSQVENVSFIAGADMNVTASTLEALAVCDAVILAEERGRSLRARIHEEHESIAALEKPVIGYVVW